MQKICKNCSQSFEITDLDLKFYEKISVPAPTHCLRCRKIRRLARINQLNLYERKCDATGEKIISNYHPSSVHKVYKQDYWYSDKWDALKYGMDFNFNMSFFEQFNELSLKVPKPALFTAYEFDENSEYTNHSGKNKNCYMIFDSDESRDCLYSYSINKCNDVMESYRARKSELCYNCCDIQNCFNCYFVENSETCNDSAFLLNCTGLKHCFMCVNLRQKEYHILNKPMPKEKYEEAMACLKNRHFLKQLTAQFQEFTLQFPQKFYHGVQNENVSGDYLFNCKNATNCFECEDLWDCKNIDQGFMPLKDCMDSYECGDGELIYESIVTGYGAYNMKFSSHCIGNLNNINYSYQCKYCSDLFGCIALKRKKYCIFNKQYTKEEYEVLVPKIIKSMIKTAEWGEFFPISISDVTYNESLAQLHFPLTREKALAKGYKWLDKEEIKDTLDIISNQIPNNFDETDLKICNELFRCTNCNKKYKIIEPEYKLYQKFKVALPEMCFMCRHIGRFSKRNKRELVKRNCMKCDKEMQTAYSTDRPEIVYCEECYLKEVF